jgi:hypothetical protein
LTVVISPALAARVGGDAGRVFEIVNRRNKRAVRLAPQDAGAVINGDLRSTVAAPPAGRAVVW